MTQINVAKLRVQDVVDILGDMQSLAFLDKSVFDAIGEQLMIIHKKRFKQQIDPDGNAWAPLNEKYLERKRKDATYQQILQYSGRLLDTLAAQATDYGVKFGSNAVYAAKMHFGDVDVHARPFIGINDADRVIISEEIAAAYEIWVTKNIK